MNLGDCMRYTTERPVGGSQPFIGDDFKLTNLA